MEAERDPASSHRLLSLAVKFRDKLYRDGYVASHTRRMLAEQMRNFRGELSQADYAEKIGKQKTVVARLENPAYGGWSLRTMLEIARKQDVAVIARFVDFLTFLSFTDDFSDYALNPQPYNDLEIENFAAYQENRTSYYDCSFLIGINNVTKMWPTVSVETPEPFYSDISFVSNTPLQRGIYATNSLISGVPPQTFGSIGQPSQGLGLLGGGGAISVPNFPTGFWSPPATPAALRRAHAEILRLNRLVQHQQEKIAALQRQLGQAGGPQLFTVRQDQDAA